MRITTLDGLDPTITTYIKVYPREGISGDTTYRVEYSFSSIPILMESATNNKVWKFIISTSTGIV